jgi:uroporphyrinogen-III synthase
LTCAALVGKQIVNTRASHQSGELDALLLARGAIPVPYPCIAIAPPDDSGTLDSTLKSAVRGEFDWLVLTSANTVRILRDRLEVLGQTLVACPGLAVAAIGPATADAVETLLEIRVDLMPGEYVAEELAAALKTTARRRILLPQAEIARTVLAEELHAAGMDVTAIAAYQTVIGSGGVEMSDLLTNGLVDAVIFTSPSTVRNFAVRLEAEGGTLADFKDVCIASIGPVTENAVTALGLANTLTPKDHTLLGVVAALEGYFSQG